MEAKLKALKVTARCVPFAGEEEPGKCIFTGQPSQRRALFAKAYYYPWARFTLPRPSC